MLKGTGRIPIFSEEKEKLSQKLNIWKRADCNCFLPPRVWKACVSLGWLMPRIRHCKGRTRIWSLRAPSTYACKEFTKSNQEKPRRFCVICVLPCKVPRCTEMGIALIALETFLQQKQLSLNTTLTQNNDILVGIVSVIISLLCIDHLHLIIGENGFHIRN